MISLLSSPSFTEFEGGLGVGGSWWTGAEGKKAEVKGVEAYSEKKGKLTFDIEGDKYKKVKIWKCEWTYSLIHCLSLCFLLSTAAN